MGNHCDSCDVCGDCSRCESGRKCFWNECPGHYNNKIEDLEKIAAAHPDGLLRQCAIELLRAGDTPPPKATPFEGREF